MAMYRTRVEHNGVVVAACLLAIGCDREAPSTFAPDGGQVIVERDAALDGASGNSGIGTVLPPDSGMGTLTCALLGQVQTSEHYCECPARLPDECTDACVDLLHDGDHCGSCDTACEPGAGCRAGICAEPPTVVGTLTGCVNPRMILHDGTLYFSDTGTGKISSLVLGSDAAMVTDIATDQMMQNPTRPMATSAIAIDDEALYWSNMGDDTLVKAPLSGGAPEVLIELDAPARGLAVGSGMVFFTHHADVFKIPTSGLAADAGAGTPPAEIDCGETGLAPVRGEPVPGATYVASSNDSCLPNGQAAALALTDTEVIYTIDGHGALDQNSQGGDQHIRLILGDDVGPARDVIALSATHAFAAGYSSVLKARLGERASYEAVVNAVDSGIVAGFSISETHVYVASDRGGISRASIDPPTDNSLVVSEHLVRDQDHPRWLVNDGTNLYWINADCHIMSVEMPP
jgi:hypothetical protein